VSDGCTSYTASMGVGSESMLVGSIENTHLKAKAAEAAESVLEAALTVPQSKSLHAGAFVELGNLPDLELAKLKAKAESVVAASLEVDLIASQSSSLHTGGWVELGKLPDWAVFDLVEMYYAKYFDEVLELLESERPRWFEDVEERGIRPGNKIAKEISKLYESKGIWISAVHPSVKDDREDSYPTSGPRFYVSVMPAAMWRGPAPPPPKDAVRILWPDMQDRRNPWITEVGWTMVPPSSDAQAMHADIKADDSDIKDPREEFQGRFHHFIWKPDRVTNCSTGVVTGAFTNGEVEDHMFADLRKVSSTVVVLDSEMCHCGSATGPDGWSGSCTVQLCSSRGWEPLQSRASKELLEYVVPIDFSSTGPWIQLPFREEEAAEHLRRGGKLRWDVGSLVEVRLEDQWFPATIVARSLTSYQVHRNGNPTIDEEVSLTNIRDRQWSLGSEVELKSSGHWYPVKLVKVNNDWSYRVEWDEDVTGTDLCYHWDLRAKVKKFENNIPVGAALQAKKRARPDSSADTPDDAIASDKRTKSDFNAL